MMDERNDKQIEKKRKYIQEKIVPRRRLKKAFMTVLTVIGLAVIFGAVAGVIFSYSQKIFGEEIKNPIQTIVIARDEITEEEEEESASEPESSTEAPTEEPQQAKQDTESGETVREIIKQTTETKVMYDAMSDRLKQVLKAAENGIVKVVSVKREGGVLEPETVTVSEAFGIAVAEIRDTCYVMTDSSSVISDREITVRFAEESVEAVLMDRDEITDLCILSFPANAFSRQPEVLKLGQSTKVAAGDDIYCVSMLNGAAGAAGFGIVSMILPSVDITDGYLQQLYTNVQRMDTGAAVLFNRDREVIGWVPASPESASGFLTANGISPLKYLIEDMCSGIETAFLGVNCTWLGAEDAERNGVSDGYYVRSVIEDSPAYLGGIQPGDRLVGIGNYTVKSGRLLEFALDELHPGDEISVTLERLNGEEYEEMEVTLKLGTR